MKNKTSAYLMAIFCTLAVSACTKRIEKTVVEQQPPQKVVIEQREPQRVTSERVTQTTDEFGRPVEERRETTQYNR